MQPNRLIYKTKNNIAKIHDIFEMWDSMESSWVGGVLQGSLELVPHSVEVASTLVKYGTPIALVGIVGYQIWQHSSNSTQTEVQQQVEHLEEFSGVLKLLHNKYTPESFNKEDTHAVYIILKGPILEIYEANEEIPFKELYNEPKIELTFNKRTTYNISNGIIKLLPEKLDNFFKWEHTYPIQINLEENSILEQIIVVGNETELVNVIDDREKNGLILFTRSDRDKEAWTNRLMAATNKNKLPIPTSDPILSITTGKPFTDRQPVYVDRKIQGMWLNSLLKRLVTDNKTKDLMENSISRKVQNLLDNYRKDTNLEAIFSMTVHKIDLQNFGTPKIVGVAAPYDDDYGLWEDICVKYDGLLKIIVEIKFNPRIYGQDDAESSASDPCIDPPWMSYTSYLNYLYLGNVLKLTSFYIEINLDLIKGGVAINIPKPPTEGAWLGFRSGTRVDLSGSVYLGSWRLPFLYKIIDGINKNLLAMFDRNFMIPNMIQMPLPIWGRST